MARSFHGLGWELCANGGKVLLLPWTEAAPVEAVALPACETEELLRRWLFARRTQDALEELAHDLWSRGRLLPGARPLTAADASTVPTLIRLVRSRAVLGYRRDTVHAQGTVFDRPSNDRIPEPARRPAPIHNKLTVVVLDERERPIAGADVGLRRGPSQPEDQKTNALGQVEYEDLVPGSYIANAWRDRFIGAAEVKHIGRADELVVFIREPRAPSPSPEPGRLIVQVHFDDNKEPASNCFVTLSGKAGREGTTDRGGVAEFSDLEPGGYFAVAAHATSLERKSPAARVVVTAGRTSRATLVVPRVRLEEKTIQMVWMKYTISLHGEPHAKPTMVHRPWRRVRVTKALAEVDAHSTVRYFVRENVMRQFRLFQSIHSHMGNKLFVDVIDERTRYTPPSIPAAALRFVLPEHAEDVLALYDSGFESLPPMP